MNKEKIEQAFNEFGIRYLRAHCKDGCIYQIYDEDRWLQLRNQSTKKVVYSFQ